MASGKTNTTVLQGTINFPFEFESIPIVVATALTSNGSFSSYNVVVHSINTLQFSYSCNNATFITWIAMT